MKQILNWVIQIAFLTSLYFGLVKEVEGALTIALVWAWFSALTVILCAFNGASMEKLAKEGRSMPVPVSIGMDIAVILLFLWHGWVWTGVIYMLHTIIGESAYAEAVKKRVESGIA